MDIVKETQRCKHSWELIPDQKLICRRGTSGGNLWRGLFSFVKPYPVLALYRMTKEEWLQHDQSFRFPLLHIPASEAFKLDNGWSVPKRDIKYLYRGPLWTEDGSTCLVPRYTGSEVAKRWAGIWKLAVIPLGLILIYVAFA